MPVVELCKLGSFSLLEVRGVVLVGKAFVELERTAVMWSVSSGMNWYGFN